MDTRLDIRKTYKLYINGKFARSESGRVLASQSAGGKPLVWKAAEDSVLFEYALR